jgi:L-iditol 2-dehydrogenase
MALCGLGPTLGAFDRMNLDESDTVLITGLGPVGLGGVINARYRGAQVIGVEPNPWRGERAKILGSEVVFNPKDDDLLKSIKDLTSGRGVDKAVDCSGVIAAQRLCIDAVRRRGTVVFVGESSQETPIEASRDLIRKGLTIMGSWHYNMGTTTRILEVIADNGTKLDKLITHSFPLDKIQVAFETQVSGKCGKVVLRPWEV